MAPDRTLEAAVAWRTVASPSGTISMVHQRAQLQDEIDIGLPGQDGTVAAEKAQPVAVAPTTSAS